jgi:hypothetical protein
VLNVTPQPIVFCSVASIAANSGPHPQPSTKNVENRDPIVGGHVERTVGQTENERKSVKPK